MLESALPTSPSNAWRRHVVVASRVALGYLIAVAVGALVFATLSYLIPLVIYPTPPALLEVVRRIANAARILFLLGVVFGIPYTVLGTVLFKLWLPKRMLVFLMLGTICPAISAMLTLVLLHGSIPIDLEFARFVILSLPAGLAAAYLYGAIGLGYGFRRWRFP